MIETFFAFSSVFYLYGLFVVNFDLHVYIMSLIERGVQKNSFDEVRINSLRNVNLLELPSDVFRVIFESLDSCSKWREVVSLADGTQYELSALEVEQCASVIYSDYSASPAKCLLTQWGVRFNMTGETLASFLNVLQIERPLKYLKLPEELVIVAQPESSVVAVEGGALELYCEATGFPFPMYEWFKEQSKIRTAVSNTGRLIVNNVTVAVAGLYVCRIHHTNHVTMEKGVKFTTWCNVQFQAQKRAPMNNKATGAYRSVPVILQHPVSQALRQNDTLTLCCQAQGSSAVECHWVKNGSLFATGNQIRIPLVDVTDAGEYYCIVKNEFGEMRSRSAVVTVNPETCIQAPVKPQLLRQPADLSVGIGGDAIFVVEAEFVNRLSYQWLHNDESIPNASQPELRFLVEDSSHEGTYQCIVSSGPHRTVLSRPAKLTITRGNIVYKAADKLALLIGVSTYKSHGIPLPAVKNDIQETSRVLKEMQFKVVSLLDLTLEEMHDAVGMFCELLSEDVYTVFYCAGHGFIGSNRRHYLIPWDAHPDVSPAECICIESIEERIQQKKPKLMVFCLDICRRRLQSDSPHVQSVDQLSATSPVPNRIVLYAASEGQQAFEQSQKNSNKPRGLFNQYLLEVIHSSRRAVDLYCALIDKFRTSPYRTPMYHHDNFQQNPEMAINCEDYYRSLHDPIDTRGFQDTINKRTLLWHRVHNLPSSCEVPLESKVGKVCFSFSPVTSNMMQMKVAMNLACGWNGKVDIPINCMPLALWPVESEFDTSTSCTLFRFANLQRLREDLLVEPQFELTLNKFCYQFRVVLRLGRPLIAQAYHDRIPATTLLGSLMPGNQTERKEAMEHTEDHSLSSEI